MGVGQRRSDRRRVRSGSGGLYDSVGVAGRHRCVHRRKDGPVSELIARDLLGPFIVEGGWGRPCGTYKTRKQYGFTINHRDLHRLKLLRNTAYGQRPGRAAREGLGRQLSIWSRGVMVTANGLNRWDGLNGHPAG